MNMGTKDPSSDSPNPPDGSFPPDPEMEGELAELLASFPAVEPDASVWSNITDAIAPRDSVPAVRRRWPYVAAVAAVAVLFLGIGAVLGGLMTSDGAVVASEQVRELVDDNGHVVLTVSTADDGSATAVGHNLPALPSTDTYQLWSVVKGEIVSVGLLGQEPDAIALRIEGDPAALALSVEVAGGVAVSSNPPVGLWTAAPNS